MGFFGHGVDVFLSLKEKVVSDEQHETGRGIGVEHRDNSIHWCNAAAGRQGLQPVRGFMQRHEPGLLRFVLFLAGSLDLRNQLFVLASTAHCEPDMLFGMAHGMRAGFAPAYM